MTESRMATPEELASSKKGETIPMISDLPVYQDDLDRIKQKKKKDFENMLTIQLNRLMNFKRIEVAHLHKATGIPFSSLYDWANAEVSVQLLDDNIKKLARYFDVTLDFLVFGTPMTQRDLELDDLMPEIER